MKNAFWEHSIKFGFLIGMALILAGIVGHYRGLSINYNPTVIMIDRLLIILGILFAIRKYRDDIYQGKITYGKAVGIGVMTSVNAGIIYSLFLYILCRFFDPNILQETISFTEKTLKNMQYSESDLELMMKMYRQITPGIYAMGQFFNFTVWGTIFTLIIAIFSRNNRFLQQQNNNRN